MPEKTEIFGVTIDNLSQEEILLRFQDFLRERKCRQVATVNAEFLVASVYDLDFRKILRETALNTADSTGILWAAKFLSLDLSWNGFYRKVQAGLQFFVTALAVVFYPGYIRTAIREKNSGIDLVWALARQAESLNKSIFLLGGFGDTPILAAQALRGRYPNLKIAGTYAGRPDEAGIIDLINNAHADILFVAFGPVRQEKWIAENRQKLAVSVAIGVGGTFDYLAKKKPLAPQILRNMGLEWAFRLVTQPYRLKRVFGAVVVFPYFVFRQKLVRERAYRKNVSACIVNDKNQVLICRKIPVYDHDLRYESGDHWMLPQGGVEPGEDLTKAVIREVEEETGLADLKILGSLPDAHKYDWPLLFAEHHYQGRYRGQSQTLFFLRTQNTQQIKLDMQEFDAYKWVEWPDLINTVHSVRRQQACIAYENFSKLNL